VIYLTGITEIWSLFSCTTWRIFSKNISKKKLLKLRKVTVIPSFLYGYETGTLTADMETRQAEGDRILVVGCGVGEVKNQKKNKVRNICEAIVVYRRSWRDHVLRKFRCHCVELQGERAPCNW
jgi:hypothetical protein